MSVHSGPSPAATLVRERESQRDYDQARESFEAMLENIPAWGFDLDAWFGSNVTEFEPIFVALVAARDMGCEEARKVLCQFGHEYARSRT